MNLNNSNVSASSEKNNHLNNFNDYFIQIDYYDEVGIKKYKTKIPLKYIFNKTFKTFTKDNSLK